MEPMPKFDRGASIARWRQEMEAVLGQVADAINNAPDGDIITGSECQVRDLLRIGTRTCKTNLPAESVPRPQCNFRMIPSCTRRHTGR